VPAAELDADNAAEFNRDIAPVLAASSKVVLDLSDVRFLDSSGLGAFLGCLHRLEASGGALKLCGMSRAVRAVFDMVRMHQIFEIHRTREEAMAAFQRAA
jgi:anti-sigma B factor antagonist